MSSSASQEAAEVVDMSAAGPETVSDDGPDTKHPPIVGEEGLPREIRKEMCGCCGGIPYATKPYDLQPYPPAVYKRDKGILVKEALAGVTVAFAQVGESVAFAFIAGVPPLQGLHAAWIIGFTTAVFGSRCGLISGATAVRAVLVAPFIEDLGIGYLPWIVMMISIYQFLFGVFKLTRFVRLVPTSVSFGFVNGLALVLAIGQIFQFERHTKTKDHPEEDEWLTRPEILWMCFEVILTAGITVAVGFIPKIGKMLPASLLGIIFATIWEHAALRNFGKDWSTPVIGDLSDVGGGFPPPFWTDELYLAAPGIPKLSWEVIEKIAFPAFIASAAGAVEAVMTMEVVADLTDTRTEAPDQQLFALSLGNLVSGLLGTMGGGATIGTSIINCTNGAVGRYRLSGIVASITVLIFILVASPLIELVPTAALVGIMVVVVFGTFEWSSIPIVLTSFLPQRVRKMCSYTAERKVNRYDALVIVVVTVVTLTNDLFIAVLAGVFLTSTATAWTLGENMTLLESVTVRGNGLGISYGGVGPVKEEDVLVQGESAEGKDWPVDSDGASSKQDKADGSAASSATAPATAPGAGTPGAGGKVTKIYRISGPLFFASTQRFTSFFQYRSDPDNVIVEFVNAGTAIRDFSALNALNSVGERYERLGKTFSVHSDVDALSRRLLLKSNVLRRHFQVIGDKGLLGKSNTKDAAIAAGVAATVDEAHAEAGTAPASAEASDAASVAEAASTPASVGSSGSAVAASAEASDAGSTVSGSASVSASASASVSASISATGSDAGSAVDDGSAYGDYSAVASS